MKVFIIDKPHNGMWGSDAIVSFSSSDAIIHIPQGACGATICRKAAVKLYSLGFTDLELTGEHWNDELLYAFWQGFFDVRHKNRLRMPIHSKELDELIKVISWVRDTINLTPSELTPATFIANVENFLFAIKGKQNITSNAYYGEELRIHNYIGTYMVGRGSVNEPGVLMVDYNPTGSSSVDLCLVGKGITFDSGGYSLKTENYMQSMKSDMGGAATLAGVLALMILKDLPYHVRLYICAAENLISGSAFKVDDIIKYPNDVTVEVKNTDAEGRLVLADGLIKSSSCHPTLIIDAATLTGAAKVAVGREYNSALSFDEKLSFGFKTSAESVGEKAWPLPLTKDHCDLVKGDISDICNSASGERYAGASSAAAFLSYFVGNNIPWLHLDLSGSYQKSAGVEFLTGAKGYGVRSIVKFIEDNLSQLKKIRLNTGEL